MFTANCCIYRHPHSDYLVTALKCLSAMGLNWSLFELSSSSSCERRSHFDFKKCLSEVGNAVRCFQVLHFSSRLEKVWSFQLLGPWVWQWDLILLHHWEDKRQDSVGSMELSKCTLCFSFFLCQNNCPLPPPRPSAVWLDKVMLCPYLLVWCVPWTGPLASGNCCRLSVQSKHFLGRWLQVTLACSTLANERLNWCQNCVCSL